MSSCCRIAFCWHLIQEGRKEGDDEVKGQRRKLGRQIRKLLLGALGEFKRGKQMVVSAALM